MATTHTSIAWTDRTWNPTRGCRRVSPGCKHCYAERHAYRFSGAGLPYEGLVTLGRTGPQWTGRGRVPVDALDDPLSWRKPQRVFVDSMSDLFFEAFTNEEIAAVFGVMAACPHITFQVLTKRSKRLREWFSWISSQCCHGNTEAEICRARALERVPGATLPDGSSPPGPHRALFGFDTRWPLPNVWLGVSVEGQEYADERIPELLGTPAAIRFVSYEPALERVDFTKIAIANGWTMNSLGAGAYTTGAVGSARRLSPHPAIDWIIVGGESGPRARPFDIRWAESVVAQCRDADVACFVKQLGSKPFRSPDHEGATGYELSLAHKKGEDPSEWPLGLRVQQFPEVSDGI